MGTLAGPISAIDGYGGAAIGVRHVTGSFAIGRLPSLPPCAVLVSPILGCILGVDGLLELWLRTTAGSSGCASGW